MPKKIADFPPGARYLLVAARKGALAPEDLAARHLAAQPVLSVRHLSGATAELLRVSAPEMPRL